MELLPFVGALLLIVIAARRRRQARHVASRRAKVVSGIAAGLSLLLALSLATAGTHFFWRAHRPLPGGARQALFDMIAGNTVFLRQGVAELPANDDRHPRTAVALDRAGRTLLLIVVDGRQPNYSEGVTLAELAAIVIEYGGDTALNLDGGGSSTMVMEGESGEPLVLSSPIDNRIPGRERPVANHLGIYARRRRTIPP